MKHNKTVMSDELEAVAKAMVAKPKGVLAADESMPTIAKRFKEVGVENTEENRQAYRETLFKAKGLGKYISGVILFTETLAVPLNVELLEAESIIPGVKVDLGKEDVPGGSLTLGLDGLGKRCEEYREQGAKFAKWRAAIPVEFSKENSAVTLENAKRLAKYAKICQDHGLVPIVEPEVLMDGSHSIDECYKKTDEALGYVFSELKKEGVNFKGMVLKPNMVLPGKSSDEEFDYDQIAELTIKVLKKNVPSEVPGIAFLSGGMSDDESGMTLSAMNVHKDLPWNLTFSYGRALLREALKHFAEGNREKAKLALLAKAKGYSMATKGEY